jgi:thiamine-monophosphate kinase
MSLLPSPEPEQTIADLGEKGLLNLLHRFCSDRVGDDCAVMGATLANQQMVVTTDMFVDGVHFSDRTTSAEDCGWRAAAANLSDLAAMGASPWGLVIALGLPENTQVRWIEGVYCGFSDCLKKYGNGAELVGGDLVQSSVKSLSVTAFGQVNSDRLIQRHTAQLGDAILITANHGRSKAGLELLLNPELIRRLDRLPPTSFDQAAYCQAVFYQAHQRPIPRLDVPPLIHSLIPNIRVSGMDSSDGLADAILQICKASGVAAKIDWESIPTAPGLELLAGEKLWDWILYGGEDFELVLTLPPHSARQLCLALPGSAIIGTIVAGDRTDGLELEHTFQHFGKKA